MKAYGYFPGCSLRATGVAYEESLLTLFRLLDLPLEELRDWNCCGATSYMAIDEESAFQLSARNLAQVSLLPVAGINVYDIIRSEKLVLTTAALKAIEARLGEGHIA